MNNWYYYVLELADEHYYVGITTGIAKRIYEHTYQTKQSAAYTKQFEVVDVVEIVYIGLTNSHYAKTIEREQTIKYMVYGVERLAMRERIRLRNKERAFDIRAITIRHRKQAHRHNERAFESD